MARVQTKSSGEFKAALTEVVTAAVCPIGVEYHRLMQDRSHLDGVLARSADRARAIAVDTMDEVRRVAGLVA